MKIKVCGLKYFSNIEEVTKAGSDLVGFIFYKGSPRYFDDSLSFDEARMISKKVGKTGVFVNEDIYSVLNAVAHFDLDFVQLHGNENPAYCIELREYVKVIKAFGVNEYFDFNLLDKYVSAVDYFLFDTYSECLGGSGKKFEHDLLKNYRFDVPFFLGGGISLEDIPALKMINSRQFSGVDINSKFETVPGIKNVESVKKFIEKLK